MNTYPKVVISKTGQGFIEKGQLWMFRNNLVEYDRNLNCGDICQIVSEDDDYLATGFYHDKSHIVVRILTHNPKEQIDDVFFEERIRRAVLYRKTIARDALDNCRMIFGEADQLGGLTIDCYNDILVSQITSYGLEIRKEKIYLLLLKVLKEEGMEINAIYERNDVSGRQKEGLSLYKSFWYGKGHSTKTVIRENGILINVDVENGQKTGYFLDQKSNRYLIQKIAKGKKVLDCFSHTGGFALNAAKGKAEKVVAVDISKIALDLGYENAKMNQLESIISFHQADVFEYLDSCEKGEFDLIILDPPAFTKSRRTIDHAYKGYKEINAKAMRILENNGYLATCSCSRYMENQLFEEMLKEAAYETGVSLRQISVTQQNTDHPILWNNAETEYLKFYLF